MRETPNSNISDSFYIEKVVIWLPTTKESEIIEFRVSHMNTDHVKTTSINCFLSHPSYILLSRQISIAYTVRRFPPSRVWASESVGVHKGRLYRPEFKAIQTLHVNVTR